MDSGRSHNRTDFRDLRFDNQISEPRLRQSTMELVTVATEMQKTTTPLQERTLSDETLSASEFRGALRSASPDNINIE